MYIERKQDLSVLYWLRDNVFEDVSFIHFEDGFPINGFEIPTISVDAKEIILTPLELGNRRGKENRVWFIDIFAKNKSQRDDFGYRILSRIEENIPVFDYDEGFPPDVSPTKLGSLIPLRIKMEFVKVIPELVSSLYWRSTVSFEATYSKPT